jgi:hypothetical protein
MIRVPTIWQAAPRVAPRICATVAETWRNVKNNLLHPYRPELHYMRGPGPKWHAKRAGMGHAAHSAIN